MTDDRTEPGPTEDPPRPLWKRAADVAFWLILIGVLVWRFGPQVQAALGIGGMDAPAPELVMTTIDGETVRLSELRGQVVLVNFWATWCAPCRVEMPGFQDVWEDNRDRGFTILGVSVDRGVRDAVAEWVQRRDYTYPIGFTSGRTIGAFGGAGTIPTSILIDRDGRIVHRIEGLYAEPALRAAVNRLLD